MTERETALHAHEVTPDDAAFMRMMAGARFGPDVTVTLPSGRDITGAEMARWVEATKPTSETPPYDPATNRDGWGVASNPGAYTVASGGSAADYFANETPDGWGMADTGHKWRKRRAVRRWAAIGIPSALAGGAVNYALLSYAPWASIAFLVVLLAVFAGLWISKVRSP